MIKRLAKKYKPDYEGKVYLETVRCFFTISEEELEKCRYNYKDKDTYAFVMSDRYIMALYIYCLSARKAVALEDIELEGLSEERRNEMEVVTEILESNLVSAIIALIGVIISLKWSTGETTKRMEQALKVYESELNRKVYVSSKRADMEFEVFQSLSKNCGEILQLMQRLYPDKLSTFQINYAEKPDLNELALKIRDLEIGINNSRAFISSEIISLYSEY